MRLTLPANIAIKNTGIQIGLNRRTAVSKNKHTAACA
jgi:hypothetical protein